MDKLSEGLAAALIGAAIAAIGYVSKLAIEGFTQRRVERRARHARLVALQSLLLASKRAFEIQNELIQRLCREIRAANKDIDGPYDQVLAKGFAALNEQQKLEHGLIRNYTINCLLPLNSQMIDWLSKDDYFKGAVGRRGKKSLSVELQQLEAHLILWRAKYEFWIPDKPERAIVYMADEYEHGIGFPTGIESLIAEITGRP